MNNNKLFDYGKKYHYMLKYFIMGLPVILLVVSLISYNSQYASVLNDVSKLMSNIRNCNLFTWYDDLLTSMNLNFNDDMTYILSSIPLFILILYMLDIILDVFALVPRLAHKFLNKFGGDY